VVDTRRPNGRYFNQVVDRLRTEAIRCSTKETNMATIHADKQVITQINVFEVEPSNQDALADLLTQAIQRVSGIPGWISASVHKSLDGTRVTNYAQAVDHSAWERIVEVLQGEGFFERFQKMSKPNPCLYRCTFSLCSE
jgi:Antibiotic biosynthesis monooxygenase